MKNARLVILGALALAAAGAGLYWLLVVQPMRALQGSLPPVDLSGVETQVAKSIATAREGVLGDGGSARSWGQLGQVLHAHSLHAPAVASYAQAQALDPTDYRWPYLAALAESKLDLARALGYFESAAALDPGSPALYINLGDLLLQLGDTQRAASQYRRALELDDDSSHARYGLARIALLDDDLGAAREYLSRAGESSPGHGEVHGLLAQVFARQGDAESAAREEQLARASASGTRPRDAVTAAMESLAVSSTAHAKRGAALANRGDFAAAEREFRRVLAIRSGHPRDYGNLGSALARQGKTKAAIAEFRSGLNLDPDDTDLLNNLGMTLADAGDLGNGAQLLERAIAVDPSFYQAHQNLGLVLERQGNLERAISHYRDALRINPAAADGQTNLGSALAKLGRLEEAAEAWTAALAGDPGNLAARFNLSIARVAQGRHADAIALLNEGRRRAPRSSRFLSLLAWELATAPSEELRDGAKSLELARMLLEADPENPERRDLLAAALAEVGRFEEAAHTAEAALATISDPSVELAAGLKQRAALYRLGRAYRQPR